MHILCWEGSDTVGPFQSEVCIKTKFFQIINSCLLEKKKKKVAIIRELDKDGMDRVSLVKLEFTLSYWTAVWFCLTVRLPLCKCHMLPRLCPHGYSGEVDELSFPVGALD